MTTRHALEMVCSLGFLSGCMGDADFRDRVSAAEDHAGRAATAAHACADDLRAMVPQGARLAGSVLEAQDAPTALLPLPRSALADAPEAITRRVRDELTRRERTIEGDLRVIAEARVLGPAALDRMRDALTQADRIRARLCEARDAAGTLAAMHEPRPILDDGAMTRK